MSALNLAFFPLFYFFSFLYYTDCGSTFMVLLMYCLHLDGRNWFASFIGALAVLFRQTNIVWVFFIAVQTAGPFIINSSHEVRLEHKSSHTRFHLTTLGQIKELAEGLCLLLARPRQCIGVAWNIVCSCIGYLLVAVAFIAFVFVNGGIVVGDRTAHQVVLHPMQILYFAAFCTALGAPYALTRIKPFLQTCKRHPILCIMATILIIGTAQSYTMAHPYLLADNRHYTFYIWRRIITGTDKMPLLLTPCYLFGGFFVLYTTRRADLAFKIAFPICVVINLVPQYLLEFRYFVVPFMLQRLQIRPQSWWNLLAEFCLFQCLNAFTLFVFMYKTFEWEHMPNELQRFMW